MLKQFSSMFPLPPSTPEGKDGGLISYLKPITDIHDVKIDFGIVDSAWFLYHPNETKLWADVNTSSYNFINLADAIAVHGAKCFLNWQDEIEKQIRIIHTEFLSVVPTRSLYRGKTPIVEKVERVPQSVAKLNVDAQGTSVVAKINAIKTNEQANRGSVELPFDYVQPCTMVEGMTTAKYPPETRKWIHFLRYIHPLIDKKIAELELYEKVSEHMGENVITHNSDTCSVDIDDWGKPAKTEKNTINPECVFAYGTPHCLREIMRERMIEDEPDEINKAWTELNGLMAKNLPIETKLTTEAGTGLWLFDPGQRDARIPHGLIMVNDFWFWKDYIDPIKIPLAEDLFAYLKDACQLVNHMYPVINKVRAEHRALLHQNLYESIVKNEWLEYKPAAPVVEGEQAPLDVQYILDRWGYEGTEVFTWDWKVGVGLAVEESYPRKKLLSGTFATDLQGNKTTKTKTTYVDDRNLIPEKVEIPIA